MSDDLSNALNDLQNLVKYLDRIGHDINGTHHAVELPGAQLITDRPSTAAPLADRLIQKKEDAELNDDEIVDKLLRQILR